MFFFFLSSPMVRLVANFDPLDPAAVADRRTAAIEYLGQTIFTDRKRGARRVNRFSAPYPYRSTLLRRERPHETTQSHLHHHGRAVRHRPPLLLPVRQAHQRSAAHRHRRRQRGRDQLPHSGPHRIARRRRRRRRSPRASWSPRSTRRIWPPPAMPLQPPSPAKNRSCSAPAIPKNKPRATQPARSQPLSAIATRRQSSTGPGAGELRASASRHETRRSAGPGRRYQRADAR